MISVRRRVTHHFLNIAVENTTEVVDGGGVHRLILPEFINGRAGDMVVPDKGIGGFMGAPQRLPKGGI